MKHTESNLLEKPVSAYQKGISLEKEFGEWLVKEQGYDQYKLRDKLAGKVSQIGYEVDVHAWENGDYQKYLHKVLAIGLFAVAGGGFLFDVSEALWIGVLFGIGLWAGKYYYDQKEIHVWAECKNQAGNVKRAQMQKLISSLEDVQANDNAKWKPNKVMFVSGSDFDSDALNFAQEKEITCYRRVPGGFIEV